MTINAITPITSVSSFSPVANTNATGGGVNFSKMLGDALDQVNQLDQNANTLSSAYATGGPVTIDQVMVAEQQASLALDTVVQVRNRVVSAYQTVMNMQV